MWKWLIVLAVLYGGYQEVSHREVHHAAGVLAADEPEQTALASPPHLQLGNYRIEPLAGYHITARVLGTESYHIGRESDLSPLDLAVGWGAMSNTDVLSRITVSQGGRFVHWRTSDYPIAHSQIVSHIANMHMIPADAGVLRALKRIRPGQVATLDGYLVEATAPDGWHWRSSLTRDDDGYGACELMWVTSASSR